MRPALDLLMQVGALPAGDIVDLGRGDGAGAPALRTRFPRRSVLGVDASSALLAKARGCHAEPDGSVLFPFRRLFLTLTKG